MATELAVFKSLKSFSGAGVWKQYTDSKGDITILPRTLIYGFNGTGKTTLSRIFSSVERGELEPRLPAQCAFEFAVSDGSSIASKSLHNPFGNRLLVFNQDFIERNFKWDDSAASPIFYLSEQSIQQKAEYDSALLAFETAGKRNSDAADADRNATDALKDFKTKAAKRVRELAPSQRYSQAFDARKIEPSYDAKSYSSQDVLDQDGLRSRQALLSAAEAKPELSVLGSLSFDVAQWWPSAFGVLKASPGTVLADEFQQHSAAITWISEGLKYHNKHGVDNCLLCGNPLTSERRTHLAAIFDSQWDEFVDSVRTVSEDSKRFLGEVRSMYQSLPKPVELQASIQAGGSELRKQVEECIKEFGLRMNQLSGLLDLKCQDPSRVPDIPEELSTFPVNEWLVGFEKNLESWNEIISRHNQEYADFASRQKGAFEDIRDHVLAEESADWKALNEGVAAAQTEATKAAKAFDDAMRKKDQLNDAMRTHGVAADKLNKFLSNYLGHGDISVRTSAEGYQLMRADGNPAVQLSEGEKTAIAFCFYLTQFEAEGRKKKELIAVIDDPISSLDTSALTHAFSLMNRMTKDCSQTIVLTHNMSFMNMVKREFTKAGGVAALLQTECASSAQNPNERISKLIVMNPLIKDYDTEYHYLFEMVLLAADKGSSEHHFLLPNATRKLLEMFTSFSAPDQTSFAAALGCSGVELKENDLKALERLVQVESHGTRDGLSFLPTLTVEEAIRAAKAAMEFIRRRDKQHHKAMCRVCKIPEPALA